MTTKPDLLALLALALVLAPGAARAADEDRPPPNERPTGRDASPAICHLTVYYSPDYILNTPTGSSLDWVNLSIEWSR